MRPRVPSLVLVLVLALGAPAVSGCGSDASDEPEPEQSALDAKRVRGFQFTVAPPAGWTDVMSEFTGQGITYDLAFADTKATGYKPNLTVSRERSTGLKGRTIEEVDAEVRLRSADIDTDVSLSTRLTVGGVEARRTTIRGGQDNRRLIRRQVIVLHDGNLYVVALASEEADPRAAGILKAFLASWRWNG